MTSSIPRRMSGLEIKNFARGRLFIQLSLSPATCQAPLKPLRISWWTGQTPSRVHGQESACVNLQSVCFDSRSKVPHCFSAGTLRISGTLWGREGGRMEAWRFHGGDNVWAQSRFSSEGEDSWVTEKREVTFLVVRNSWTELWSAWERLEYIQSIIGNETGKEVNWG